MVQLKTKSYSHVGQHSVIICVLFDARSTFDLKFLAFYKKIRLGEISEKGMIWGFPPGRLFKAGRLLISDNFPLRMLIKGRTLIDFWKISLQDAYSRKDGY